MNDRHKTVLGEVFANPAMVRELAKNDFKTKFAGSYLGVAWGFIQPVVTILVYWFVFQVGLKQHDVAGAGGLTVPYVLWLIAGIIPWFFFSDALNSAANALVQYSYLVKKVVFAIGTLPVIKVLSALFVHLFFMAFLVVAYACCGLLPTLYTLQILYYTFAMLVLVLGLSYINCALVVFFRDWAQLVNIALNVGIWITPILWRMEAVNLPGWAEVLLKLNPMYYITAGYRDALITHVYFWERPGMTVYFWVLTLVFFLLGDLVFKRLRPHFADVL